MSKTTKAYKLAQQLIKKRILTGAQAEIIDPKSDTARTWLVHKDMTEAVLITQKYTYNLSKKASEIYMVIGYNPEWGTYRVYHDTGFTASNKLKFLGAMLAGHWEARRAELIYNDEWDKPTYT